MVTQDRSAGSQQIKTGQKVQAHHERRRGESAIPCNLRSYLNDEQRRVLRQVGGFGWKLAIIRRPLFQDPVVIISDADEKQYSVLQGDGAIDAEPNIFIRH